MRLTPSWSRIGSCSLFSLALLGCSNFTYDPPPDVSLVLPDVGAFDAGDPVVVSFSEPVDPATVEVRLWQTLLDDEQEIPGDAEPIIASCKLSQESCGELSFNKIEEEGELVGLEIAMDKEGLGKPGSPIIVEFLPGLSDPDGFATGRSIFYDIVFRDPDGRFNDEPVPFQQGTYIFSSVIDKPLPAVLTLISDVVVMPDGRFYLSGGEGDEINGAPKTTVDPENLIVDPTDQGWAAHIAGFVKLRDGKRLLETDPIDIVLPIKPLQVRLEGTRLNASVVKDDDGNDRFEGTLSFERVVVVNGSREIEQRGGSEALVGYFVPPDITPDNHPFVCGDQCGAIIGLCDVPEGFPEEDVCENLPE